MQDNRFNPWLHRFAIAVALCALGLIGIGGLVTSHGVGMAVPDWPTSFGYNMFALPVSLWLTGGVFHEHTHRQWASVVGVLVVLLMRWVGGRKACLPLLVIGGIELLAGFALPLLGSEWKGGGFFLSGIGGVVLLAGIIWSRNEPAPGNLPALGWFAFWLVQLQGLLGGLRVVLDAHLFAGTKLGVVFGIFHGCLGQAFFVLLCVIALMTSRWCLERFVVPRSGGSPSRVNAELRTSAPRVTLLLLFTTVLIFLQLILGATMRHQHAGLAIPDFPRAHGQWCPLLPWGDDTGTVGATVATATSGPFAERLGRPRDLVLGLECVDGTGRVIAAGGKVVKNVAGFDLTRAVTGSWGTLAVITQLHLRLRARPTVDETWALSPPNDEDAAVVTFDRGHFAPLAALAVSEAHASALALGGARWLVRIGGNAAFVAAARDALRAIGDSVAVDPAVWDDVRTRLAPPARAIRWRWDALSSRLRERFDPARVLNPGLLGEPA